MVHPSELIRGDSIQRSFSAPLLYEKPLDCGLTNLPCLNHCFNLEKFAKSSVFLVFLSIVACLQGVVLQYFRGTSKHWSKHYNLSQENIDWIVYTNEFLVGVFALVVSYWGNRVHRISWIGSLTIYHSLAALILIIPEIHKNPNFIPFKDNTCVTSKLTNNDLELDYIAIVLLAIFQTITSMTYISFISHGITYLDDNVEKRHSPIFIALALAAKEIGTQVGLYTAKIPDIFDSNNIFVSPVWITIGVVTFTFGVFITMFPRSLPTALVKRRAASLINLAAGRDSTYHNADEEQTVDGFFKTFWRLLCNKFLMVNILSVVIFQSAVINFKNFEKPYNQARFFLSTDATGWTKFIFDLIKQPLIAMALIVTGLTIAKLKPLIKSLVKWNIFAYIIVILLFASTAFLKCKHSELATSSSFSSMEYCSSDCNCPRIFQPVCVNEESHFSPCFAGCKDKDKEQSQYTNCSCALGKMVAEGACKSDECFTLWTLSQVNPIFSDAFLASTTLANIIITMLCINSKDKAAALGLQMTFLGLIPYLPIKLIYGAIADTMCSLRSNDTCYMYNEMFALFLSLATIVLILLAVIVSIILLFIKIEKVTNENFYDENSHWEEMVDASLLTQNDHENVQRIAQSNPDSLASLENVGDDHDSVNSLPEQNKSQNNALLESSF